VGSKEQGWTPAIDLSGIVYTGNNTGELIATHSDGTTLWTYDVPPPKSGGASAWIQAAPALADDGTVYFGALSGFYAFTPAGKLKWSVPWNTTPQAGSGASVAIGADGTVFVASPDATLRSITPTGTVNWTLPIGTPESPPVIDGNGIIYLLADPTDSGSETANLYAVTPAGTLAWSLVLTAPLPGVHQGGLAFGTDGTLYAAVSPIDMMFAIGN
jgi:outer membrane protein assembly factor BamB